MQLRARWERAGIVERALRRARQSFVPAPRLAATHPGDVTAGRMRGTAEWSIALLVGVGVAALVVGTHVLGLDSPVDGGPAAALIVVGLFTISELTTIRLSIHGQPVIVTLRAIPLLVGLVSLEPLEVIAAQVIGVAIALVSGRRPTAGVAAITIASAALGTALAVLGFYAVEAALAGTTGALWVGAYVATIVASAGSTLGAVYRGAVSRPALQARNLVVPAVYGTLVAVADASLGITVLIFTATDPSDLWLLLGPALVGAIAFRAYGRMRRQDEGVAFLYTASQVLDGPSAGDAMLTELLELTRTTFGADVAEIFVTTPDGGTARASVGPGPDFHPLVEVDDDQLALYRAMLPPGRDSGLRRRTGEGCDEADRLIAAFRDARAPGILVVAGRPLSRPFDDGDLRLLEALAADVGSALASSRTVAEVGAALDDAAQLAALVAASDDAIVGVAPDGSVQSWSHGAAAMFGFPAEEVVGLRPWERMGATDVTTLTNAFESARSGRPVRGLQTDVLRRDGTLVPVSVTMSPIRRENEITGVSVVAHDQTARTLQDTALRESLQRFRSVFEGSPLGMGIVGPDFRWQRVNESLCRMLGTREADLVGRRFEVRLERGDVAAAHGLVSRLLRGESTLSTLEVTLHTQDGDEPVIASLVVRALRTPGQGTVALCAIEDITARRRAERQARETEARVHQALLDLTAIREPQAVLVALLRAARGITGAADGAIRVAPGGSASTTDVVYDGDPPAPGLVDLMESPRWTPQVATSAERVCVTPDAGRPPEPSAPGAASVLAVPITADGRHHGTLVLIDKARTADKAGTGAMAFTAEDRFAVSTLAAQAAISLDNALAHQGSLSMVRELDQVNAALQSAAEAKSRFLANASHELRSPLHSILLAARILDSQPPDRPADARTRSLPTTIEHSVSHLIGLLDDLADLTRTDLSELRLRVVDTRLAPLLAEVTHQAQPLAEEQGIRLSVGDARGIAVSADPLRLRQVLLNLVWNAIKYTPPGGRVSITATRRGDTVRIRVRDTGAGMTPAELELAFEPFERLGRSGAGAGLGLTIARRITEQHGGRLTATSVPGRGSTFTVAIAAARSLPAGQPAEDESGVPAGEPAEDESGVPAGDRAEALTAAEDGCLPTSGEGAAQPDQDS
jgi:PAS domain S-box-containing protein